MEFHASDARRAKLSTTTDNQLSLSGTTDSALCELRNVAEPTTANSGASRVFVDKRVLPQMVPANLGYTFASTHSEGTSAGTELTVGSSVVFAGWVGGTVFNGDLEELGVVATVTSATTFTLAGDLPVDVSSGDSLRIGAINSFRTSYNKDDTGPFEVLVDQLTSAYVGGYIYTPDGTFLGRIDSIDNSGSPHTFALEDPLAADVSANSGIYHFHGLLVMAGSPDVLRGSTSSIAIGTAMDNEEYLLGAAGYGNIAMGFDALFKVTTGYKNMGLGSYSGGNITVGSRNLAVGYNSLNNVSIGSRNAAVGVNALNSKSNNLQMTLSNDVSFSTALIGGSSSGTSHTGAINAWQKIIKDSGNESADVTRIDVMLSNTGSAVSVVLKIYDGETDDSSANPNTRFSGMTPVLTTPSVSVSTASSTKVAFEFDLSSTTLTGTTYSFWIQEASGGSLGTMQVQRTSSGTDGGSGNSFGTLNHEVRGVAQTQTFDVSSSANVLNSMALYTSTGTEVAVTDGTSPAPSGTQVTATFSTTDTLSSGTALYVADNPSTAVGAECLQGETYGGFNTAVGTKAFQHATTARWGVAMGYQAASALTTGNYSTCVGYNCASSLVTGGDNVVIGANANVSSSSAQGQIVIGEGATGQGDNYAVIGNASITRLYANQNGDGVLYANATIQSSDRRLKDDIETLPLGLAWVQRLQPVQFRWKDGRQGGKRSLGLVAQDVVAALASSGLDPANYAAVAQDDDEARTYRLDYTQLLMPLITAVQELSARVRELERQRAASPL